MEVYQPLYGGSDAFAARLAEVKRLQDAIGEMRDVQVCCEKLVAEGGAELFAVLAALARMHRGAFSRFLLARQPFAQSDGRGRLFEALLVPSVPSL